MIAGMQRSCHVSRRQVSYCSLYLLRLVTSIQDIPQAGLKVRVAVVIPSRSSGTLKPRTAGCQHQLPKAVLEYPIACHSGSLPSTPADLLAMQANQAQWRIEDRPAS